MSAIIYLLIALILLILVLVGVSIFYMTRPQPKKVQKEKKKSKSKIQSKSSDVEKQVKENSEKRETDIFKLQEPKESIDPDTVKLPFESKALVSDEDLLRLKKIPKEDNTSTTVQTSGETAKDSQTN